MKTLRLTLNKKWFLMILSGEKKEEYREIKPYWCQRFANLRTFFEVEKLELSQTPMALIDIAKKDKLAFSYITNRFDIIEFVNGYSKDSPRFTIECKGIEIGKGKQEWGAEPDTDCFIIKLGDIL